MGIKSKNRDPKSTDFSGNDIIINNKEGSIFYKGNGKLYKLTGDNVNTSATESNSYPHLKLSTISASSNITAHGNITGTKIIADNTDNSASFNLLDVDGNTIAQLARVGQGGNAHVGKMVLRDNASIKVDIRAKLSSYIAGDNAKLGIGTTTPGEALEVVGNIDASGNVYSTNVESTGTITAVSGAFSYITASILDVDANTIRFGGLPFGKNDVQSLNAGLFPTTIEVTRTSQGDRNYNQYIKPQAIFSPVDESTYAKYTTPARIGQFINGVLFFDQNLSGSNNYVKLGTGTTDIILSGSIIGSTINGGSF